MNREKRCPRCGKTKPIEGNFYVGKAGPVGYCIPCTKEKVVEWQKKNPDRKAAADARHYRANPERRRKMRERFARWKNEHPEKVPGIERIQRWVRDNPERHSRALARYRKSPAGRATQKRYRNKPENREKIRQRARSYGRTLVTKIREHLRSARRYGYEVSIKTRAMVESWLCVVAAYGNACAYCGVSGDPMSLEVDHVVPRTAGGSDDLGNLVPACRSCNAKKRSSSLEAFCARVGLDPIAVMARHPARVSA